MEAGKLRGGVLYVTAIDANVKTKEEKLAVSTPKLVERMSVRGPVSVDEADRRRKSDHLI
jgi:hypothetical protein